MNFQGFGLRYRERGKAALRITQRLGNGTLFSQDSSGWGVINEAVMCAPRGQPQHFRLVQQSRLERELVVVVGVRLECVETEPQLV